MPEGVRCTLQRTRGGLEEGAEHCGAIGVRLASGLVRARVKEELSLGLARKTRESGLSQRSPV